MKRRDFIKRAAVGAAAAATLAGGWSGNLFAHAEEVKVSEKKPENTSDKPLDMVAIYGGTAVEMFEKGIAEMGGIERFVKKGQTVVLKPNIGWGPSMGLIRIRI